MDLPRVNPRFIAILRWIGRIWGLGLLALAIIMIVTPDPYAQADIAFAEYLIPAFLVGGAVVGSLVAWRWEGLGGAMVVGGWLAAILWDHVVYDRWLPISMVATTGLFFATPGLLFLLCWFLSRQPNHPEDRTG
jgi:hypothetical protein